MGIGTANESMEIVQNYVTWIQITFENKKCLCRPCQRY